MKKLSLLMVLVATLSVLSTGVQATCFAEAAARYKVSERLLRSIQYTENRSGRADLVSPTNSDGSRDIGLMQINSSWLPKLARYGIRREDLFNACVNGYVGTWILAANIRQFGPTWKAVGAYNAVSTPKQLIYANAIYRRLQRQGH